jgi:hypothetical protein
MEAERTMHSRRPYAPSNYRVLISSVDHAALDPTSGSLLSDLGESLRRYARAHGYTLLAQPRVDIEASTVVQQGDIRVFATPVSAPPATNGHAQGNSKPAPEPANPANTDAPSAGAADAEEANDEPVIPIGEATAVFAAASPNIPRAVLAVRCPGQTVSRIPVRPGTIRLGRALDNDVVLSDDRVSRRHGQIGIRHGMLVYTDLGSTNGSFLNSAAVTEIALGPGDVLQLGSSTITIEPSP